MNVQTATCVEATKQPRVGLEHQQLSTKPSGGQQTVELEPKKYSQSSADAWGVSCSINFEAVSMSELRIDPISTRDEWSRILWPIHH